MSLPSVAEYYHDQTKYTPEGIQRAGRGLDFDRQPVPFKDYATGIGYDLTRFLPPGDQLRSDQELAKWRETLPEADRALAELSHLLYFTNGITAVVPYAGQPFLMRAAPSAGGLYPTEIYVASRGHALLPDGLYNYQVRDHSLVHFFTQDVWPQLLKGSLNHPALNEAQLAVIVTGVFYRSAWRYEDRAYRRVMLDTGHVLGNLAMYAPKIGRHILPIGGFADDVLNEMLFLDREEEGVIAVAALLPAGSADVGPTALPGPRTDRQELPEGQRMAALHAAGVIATPPAPTGRGFSSVAPAAPEAPPAAKIGFGSTEPLIGEPIDWDEGLGPTLLKRRSTRAFTGEGLTRAELARLLEFAYRPDLAPDQPIEHNPRYFAPELLQTYVAVHDVAGLDAGCYHYAPDRRVLRQIRFTELRKQVQYLALGQDLAGRAGVVVFHTVDLPAAIAQYGDRVYRYLHLDAGHLGQRLNIAAIKMGLGVSGIGGFFDDQVNEMLGIPEQEAVLYITTLGRPGDG